MVWPAHLSSFLENATLAITCVFSEAMFFYIYSSFGMFYFIFQFNSCSFRSILPISFMFLVEIKWDW